MIGWEAIYNVLSAMLPLYVALILGYGSVKWWHIFNPDHCDAINQLNYYFIMPLFSFDFTSRINPYEMNHLFIAADIISKTIILFTISLWANCSTKGNYPWSVTSFSLSSLNNSLIVGVPLMHAMYGSLGENLVILSSILQSLLWNMCLLFMLEFHRVKKELDLAIEPSKSDTDVENNGDEDTSRRTYSVLILLKIVGIKLAKNPNSYGCMLGLSWALISNRWNVKMPSIIEGSILIMSKAGSGVAMFCMGLFMALQEKIIGCGLIAAVFGMLLRFVVAPATMAVGSFAVGLKGDVLRIAIIQVIWIRGIYDIMKKTNSIPSNEVMESGQCNLTFQFHQILQNLLNQTPPNIVVVLKGMKQLKKWEKEQPDRSLCSLHYYLTIHISRTCVLNMLQTALPQAVSSFVFANEYGLHANVLSTGVIFGTIISIPVLLTYYAVLDLLHG